MKKKAARTRKASRKPKQPKLNDLSAKKTAKGGSFSWGVSQTGLTSLHAGGVNVALGDGSVRPL
jgi:prepilin-type processing-associated H-X9-DG protein